MSGNYGQQQFQQQQFKHKPSDTKAAVDVEDVKKQLKLPATGLFITGLLSVLLTIGGTVGTLVYGSTQTDKIVSELTWRIFGVDEAEEANRRNASSKKMQDAKKNRETKANAAMTLMLGSLIITALVLCSFYIFAVSGGLLMGQVKNYKVCKIACIIALIPIVSPLVVLGIPFGAIGLKKLSEPDVKKAFAANA